jgi:hypothetical protein
MSATENDVNARKANLTAGPTGIVGLENMAAGYNQQGDEARTKQDEVITSGFADVTAAQKERERTPAPKLENLPDRPKLEMGNWAKMAAGLFSVLAVAGSKSMRTGSVGAMNAMNGALIGLHTGNEAAYQRGLDEYNDSVTRILAKHKEELTDYHKVLDDKTLSIQEKIDHIKLRAKMYGDTAIENEKEYTRILSLIGTKVNAAKQIEIAQTKLPKPAAKIQDLNAWKKANPKHENETPEDYDKRARVGIDTSKKKGGVQTVETPGEAKTKANLKAEYKAKYPDATDADIDKAIKEHYPNAK